MSDHVPGPWAGIKMLIWRIFHLPKQDLFTTEWERQRREKYEGEPETLNGQGE